jgi:guanylate kinase
VKGKLLIVSGPAGVGKGTVISEALKQLDRISYSVSCTTRAPRPGEIDGVNYHFLSEEEFRKMVGEGLFLEWANVHGHLYGTRRDIVEASLAKGSDILLEIDVQGALQVKEKMPEAVTIFILPPSFDELVRRLKSRGTETPEEIAVRVKNAETELGYAQRYDYQIVNDKIADAAQKFIQIVKQYREEPK